MRKGRFSIKKYCRLCQYDKFDLFLDLGWMPHAGNFLSKKEIGSEYWYPLKIYACKKCGLVQVLDVIPSKVLFKNYHYLSSISLASHFKKYADEMVNKFLNKKSFVVEIGSNDGVLLHPLKEYGLKVLGVDPSVNIAKVARNRGVETIIDGFSSSLAKKIINKKGKADAIFANNVLAHIDDINDVFNGIKLLLNKDGILVAEVHYLPDLIKKNQYDFFYNEHLCYYSLETFTKMLKRHGLIPFDVKKVNVHSGSIRIYAKFKDNKKYTTSKRLKALMNVEKKSGFNNIKNYKNKIQEHKESLNLKLAKIKNKGYKIVGYGASGRANTVLNYCGIDVKTVDYIVDESPERYGKYTPGTHIPIVKPEIFRKDKKADYAILLAWNYKKEIIKKEQKFIKRGGKFILPFPRVSIISRYD